MRKQSKKSEAKGKGRGKKVEAASAGTDDDFDEMLAELRVADVTAEAATSSSRSASSSNSSSTSISSSSTTNRASAATAEEVSEKALLQACASGDISQLRRWARRGVRVISADPLCIAVGLSMYEVAQYLVGELEADVNLADDLNFTPLSIAAQVGDLMMVQYLVNELEADVNRADAEGRTPLSVAAESGHVAMVRCLVNELGANVNRADNSGCSPSYFPAQDGNLEVVQCLVGELDADINYAVQDGSPPLMAAAERMHHKVVRYLLKHGADPLALHNDLGTAADISENINAPGVETAYLQARTHCANPGCTDSGLKKCERCLQAYFCGNACIRAHWPAHKAESKVAAAKLNAARGLSSSSSSMPL
jgi:hypothetical protein